MKVYQESLEVRTPGRGLHRITTELSAVIERAHVDTGVCHVFLQHTSASLVIQENADAAVLRDLERWMNRIAPEDAKAYEHDAEGSDDMPAHLRSAVTRTSETLPVCGSRLGLGTWQALYLWEHRRAPHRRTLVVTVMGV